jgi:hypothetical protein
MRTTTNTRIIAVAMQNGGAGKTTVTRLLCEALAARGHSVLAVDADAQGSLTLRMGVERLPSTGAYLGSVMLGEHTAEELLDIVRPVPGVPNLDIIPSSYRMVDVDDLLSPKRDRLVRLGAVLDQLRGFYDFIVIDTPPHIGPLMDAAIYAASDRYETPREDGKAHDSTTGSGVIFPVKPAEWIAPALETINEQVDSIGSVLNVGIRKFGLVITDYRKGRSGGHDRAYGRLCSWPDLDALATVRERTVVPDSGEAGELVADGGSDEANGVRYGAPLSVYKPGCDVLEWFDYLARVLTGAEVTADETEFHNPNKKAQVTIGV